MPVRPRRLVIVRRGDVNLFKALQQQFADDPDTVIIWDRRGAGDRRQVPGPWTRREEDCRAGERRYPESASALSERGFFVTREAWTRDPRIDEAPPSAS